MEIRHYNQNDEIGWVRCRALSFLDTAFYDNVLREKEKYENPAIELVAVENDQHIVGLIDIEYELEEGTICSRGKGLGGMIWHVAVHPDFRRKGVGHQLLQEAEKLSIVKGLNRLEAWTRDDDWVNNWYMKNGFVNVDSYLQVFINGSEELDDVLVSKIPDLIPVQAFTHYIGEEKDFIRKKFKRVHEDFCYEKKLV